MTLGDLSARTDIDDTYLGRVERAEINITLNTLEKIIAGLSMTTSQFFSFLEAEEKQPEIFQLVQTIAESKERDKIVNLINGILSLNHD
ncbi:helix-turn-helix domain-containing protein [Enterococcus sp. DIV0187]|uniref:helix-turn-helix domain-containing protein n=1 Tax=Enterococcus sp. DIV0187 TaxID=2774644 RepID=UPI003F682449